MRLGFAIRLYLQNLRASRNLNLLSIGIITFSFLILGLFLLAAKNLELVVEKWGEQIQVVVFLKDSIKTVRPGRNPVPAQSPGRKSRD